MDFKNLKPETREHIFSITVSGIFIVLFYILMNHLSEIFSLVGKSVSALAPFLFGICIAFVLVPLRKLIENKWLVNTDWNPRTKRVTAVGISIGVFILFLVILFYILIPQVANSLQGLINSLGSYVSSVQEWIESTNWAEAEYKEYLVNLLNSLTMSVTNWLTGAAGGLGKILSYSLTVARGVLNFFIGVIIAFYILLDQERFILQGKKLTYAILEKDAAIHLEYVTRLTTKMFNAFIFGKALDSLIIGIVCYICMVLMNMPYAPLIGVVVGVTNMIPVFGPFLGAIPCTIILLMIDPIKALEFAIYILILQQVDGNIIGPYILGDSMGLPTLWIMFAILIGGAMFGIAGMFLSVPIFSVIYVLIREWARGRLNKKKIHFES